MKTLTYPLFVSAIADSVSNDSSPLTRHLSPHFHLLEFVNSSIASSLGISNMPDFLSIQNLVYLCHYVLEPLRSIIGPIIISSGYRCKTLNEAINGASANSYHLYGRAADIFSPYVSLSVIESHLRNLPNVKYLRYSTFIHVQV